MLGVLIVALLVSISVLVKLGLLAGCCPVPVKYLWFGRLGERQDCNAVTCKVF